MRIGEVVEYSIRLQGFSQKDRLDRAYQISGDKGQEGDLNKRPIWIPKAPSIFSTHDSMAMDYADRIVSLRDGRLADDRSKML